MSLGKKIPFVELEPRAGGAVQQRSIERCGALTCAEHPGIPRSALGEMLRNKRLHLALLHTGSYHRHAIGDNPVRTLASGCAERVQLRATCELSKGLQIQRGFTAGHLDLL